MGVLEFNLTATPLAASTEFVAVPTDCELFAVLLALLAVERCSYAKLAQRTLELRDENLNAVAQMILGRFPIFFQRATNEEAMRACLSWFSGLRVTRFDLGGM